MGYGHCILVAPLLAVSGVCEHDKHSSLSLVSSPHPHLQHDALCVRLPNAAFPHLATNPTVIRSGSTDSHRAWPMCQRGRDLAANAKSDAAAQLSSQPPPSPSLATLSSSHPLLTFDSSSFSALIKPICLRQLHRASPSALALRLPAAVSLPLLFPPSFVAMVAAAGGARRRRAPASSEAQSRPSGGAENAGMLRFYTDDAPGLKMSVTQHRCHSHAH